MAMERIACYANGLRSKTPDPFGAAIGETFAQFANESLDGSSVVEYGCQPEIAERHLSQVGERTQMVEVYEIG